MRTYVCIRTYIIHTYIHEYVHTYIHTYKCKYNANTYINIHIMHALKTTHIIQTYIQTYIHCTYKHTCMHMHITTQTLIVHLPFLYSPTRVNLFHQAINPYVDSLHQKLSAPLSGVKTTPPVKKPEAKATGEVNIIYMPCVCMYTAVVFEMFRTMWTDFIKSCPARCHAPLVVLKPHQRLRKCPGRYVCMCWCVSMFGTLVQI